MTDKPVKISTPYKQKEETMFDNLTSEELAYVAGIIDGEGCISVSSYEYSDKLYLSIVSTSRELMEWLSNKLHRDTGIYKVKGSLDRKDLIYLRLYSSQAKELISKVKPYLIIKKAHAELAKEFPVPTGPSNYTPLKISKKRRELGVALRALNQRGSVNG